jgi:hypothetical protein
MKHVTWMIMLGVVALAGDVAATPTRAICTPIGVQADSNIVAIRCSLATPSYFAGMSRSLLS